jgi:hypothetical protein
VIQPRSPSTKIIAALNPGGLHFAFLDPFNIEALSFDLIKKTIAVEAR